MKIIKRFLYFLFYSNLWISTAAFSFSYQLMLFIPDSEEVGAYSFYLGFSTLFVYAVHRLLAIRGYGINDIADQRRQYIKRNAWLNQVALIVGGIGAFYFWWQLSFFLKWSSVLVAILPFLYTIPVRPFRKLREYWFVKTGIVALAWSLLFVLPLLLEIPDRQVIWVGLEKFSFIFAITLPFDIRDWSLDQREGVSTIPIKFGFRNSVRLCLGFVGLALLSVFYYHPFFEFNNSFLWKCSLFYIVVAVLVYYSYPTKHDFYYSGFLDGSIILQAIILLCLC